MKKQIIFFMGIIFVFILLSFISAENPTIITDSLNRTVQLIYADSSQNVLYEYYGDTPNTFRVVIGNGAEVYIYDFDGSILSEEYSQNPEKNKYYLYYPDGNLQTIFNSDSTIDFTYYPDGDLEIKKITVDNVVLITLYDYYPNGQISDIIDLGKKEHFDYNSEGRISREEILRQVNGGAYKTTEGVNYIYDSGGNILTLKDDTGVSIKYNYDLVNYPCQKSTCIDVDCNQVVYTSSTCDYSQLKSKVINNYEVSLTDIEANTLMGNTWSSPYVPNLKYDAKGNIIQSDKVAYSYDGDYNLNKVLTDNSDLGSMDLVLNYNNQEIDTSTYASDFLDYGLAMVYDPLDEIIKEDFSSNSNSFSPISGNVISNLFRVTGNAISNSNSFSLYYASADDSGSAVTLEEYSKLASPEIVWPELASYYVGLVDANGVINNSAFSYPCVDSDENLSENSIFNFGSARQGNNIIYDGCQNNKTLLEGYCGTNLNWELWNLPIVPKQRIVSCEFGCNAGACLLTNPITTIPSNNTSTNITSNVSNLELPPTPTKPGAIS